MGRNEVYNLGWGEFSEKGQKEVTMVTCHFSWVVATLFDLLQKGCLNISWRGYRDVQLLTGGGHTSTTSLKGRKRYFSHLLTILDLFLALNEKSLLGTTCTSCYARQILLRRLFKKKVKKRSSRTHVKVWWPVGTCFQLLQKSGLNKSCREYKDVQVLTGGHTSTASLTGRKRNFSQLLPILDLYFGL